MDRRGEPTRKLSESILCNLESYPTKANKKTSYLLLETLPFQEVYLSLPLGSGGVAPSDTPQKLPICLRAIRGGKGWLFVLMFCCG